MPKVWRASVAVAVLLALALAPRSSGTAAGGAVNFAPPNLPEGLAVDSVGNTYVGFAPTGEIRRIAPDGGVTTLARLRTGIGTLLGLAVDAQGNVLAALNSKNTPAPTGTASGG